MMTTVQHMAVGEEETIEVPPLDTQESVSKGIMISLDKASMIVDWMESMSEMHSSRIQTNMTLTILEVLR